MDIDLKKTIWAFAFLLMTGAWVSGLFIDLTGDAGLYAAISRQMVESGDWLNLKINGAPYDQKPHLLFWLAGAGISLFGNNNFAFKLFPFLFGLMGIYFTYRLGRLIFSETAGKLAALFTGTSQMYFLYFLDIHTDTVLQSAVILTLWQLAAYLKHKKPIHFVIAFLGTGLAMLTKGPVGAVLPFLFVLFYLLLNKDYRQLFHFKWLAGIALTLLIISPALYHLWESFGIEGLRFYFIDNNLGRVSGAVAGSSTDPFFYLYNLLWAFLPWTIPVLAGLTAELNTWFKGRPKHTFSASLLGSVLVLFIIYSIARGKAPNYLMLLLPPMAVVAAGRVQSVETWSARKIKTAARVQFILLQLMFLLPVFMLIFILPGTKTFLFLMFPAAGAILSGLYFHREHFLYKRILLISLLASVTFNVFLNTSILPMLFRYQGTRQVMTIHEEMKKPGERLYVFELEEYELYFYAEQIHAVKGWEHFFEILKISGSWIYTNQIKFNDLVNLGYEFEKVYKIEQRGMNKINFKFLLHFSRQQT